MVTRLTILLVALGLAGPAMAGPFEDGVAAYNRSDYATAMSLLRPLADRGHAGAQYKLGVMYAYGRGVPQDDVLAVALYRKAADQEDTDGQFGLGVMYEYGRGVPQDFAQAVAWYHKA